MLRHSTCAVVRVSSWSLLTELFLSKVFMLGLQQGQLLLLLLLFIMMMMMMV